MSRSILAGATCGIWTWLVYGIVEFVLACAIPVLSQADVELLGWQWRLIAMVFGVYALLGVVLGSAGGVLLAWTGRHRKKDLRMGHKIVAALALTAAFVVNLIPARSLGASEYLALAIALVFGLLFAGALASSLWLERAAFLANPWAVSLLLLTVPWVGRVALVQHSVIVRTGASLLLFGVVVVLAALWHRLRLGQMKALPRRAIIAGTAAVLLLGGLLASTTSPTADANQNNGGAGSGKCNVVLITMDTVRADHLSVYGYERDTTPHLRDFARRATVYSRAIATSDWTLATHASIFTGLYPRWHGAYFAPPDYPWGRPLAARYTTLAEVLSTHGYWTAAEVANYGFLGPWLGLAKGFATYHSPRAMRLSQTPGESPRSFYLREGARRLLSLMVDTSAFDQRLLQAADVNRHAFALLDRARQGGPFFLFLNYMDSHGPYLVPTPFNTRFPGRDPRFKTVDFADVTWAVNSDKRHLSAAERSHLVSQYDGGIAYEDQEIGSLLSRLHELGLYDNTLIIITADHGEAFGEHNLMDHSVGAVYQGLIRVPLLIKYPGQHEAQQSDALVSQVDLMPTVLDLAGCELPAGVQGRNLQLPRDKDSDAVFSEAIAATYLLDLNPRFRGVRRGIFAGSWKLITWTDGPPELYDLATDPEETRNLYQTRDPRAKALADRLSAWAAAAPRPVEQPHQLDKNSVEKLKSLGYAQ